METGLQQNARFIREVYRKAVITGMLAILSVNINVFVDGILVGSSLGADALAAINLSMPVYWALCVAGVFFAAGTEIPAARAIGMGDAERMDDFFSTGLNASVLISLVITAAALVFLRPMVSFLCAEESIRPYVTEYVSITMIGALPRIVIYIPFWYLRLDGKNRDITIMMVGMAGINIVLDIVFVSLLGMGLFGAGLASTVATAAACGYGLIRLFAKDSGFRWHRRILRSAKEWKTIVSAGFPSAFNNLCSTMRLLIANALLLAHGGGALVAVYSAVSGIWGFGECITLGVPAAANVMLAVFSGERDNGSCRLLLREAMKTGSVAGAGFLILCLALSGVIPGLYGLSESMLVPLIWMSLSVFPALFLNLMFTYYNIAGRDVWANALILLRQVVMVWAGLRLVTATGFSVFSFLLFAEVSTVAVWWAATGIHHLRNPQDSRYLMMNLEQERLGKVLNFSVGADVDEIVSASERISSFCSANGMSSRSTVWLQMSMEEVMTLIHQVNMERGDGKIQFDLRAYSVSEVRGIRIRYSGIPFNPFGFTPESGNVGEDMYMGVRMIQRKVEHINYQRAFGVNTLQILLKEESGNEA